MHKFVFFQTLQQNRKKKGMKYSARSKRLSGINVYIKIPIWVLFTLANRRVQIRTHYLVGESPIGRIDSTPVA
ncbi:hypothetical protein COA09_27215 [Bacillus cereus]|nr:hypothetical protein COA09_27215 [Bacillus cereus]PGV16594.1 hypothetical protein COD77_06980 [Bacillus cereus]